MAATITTSRNRNTQNAEPAFIIYRIVCLTLKPLSQHMIMHPVQPMPEYNSIIRIKSCITRPLKFMSPLNHAITVGIAVAPVIPNETIHALIKLGNLLHLPFTLFHQKQEQYHDGREKDERRYGNRNRDQQCVVTLVQSHSLYSVFRFTA